MSEKVNVYCLSPYEQYCSYFMARTSCIGWDDDDVRFFLLDQHALLDVYSASSLKQPFAVCMLLHSDSLSWFRTNQSLLFFLNAVCLTEQKHAPIWSDRTRGKYANHYTTGTVGVNMTSTRACLNGKCYMSNTCLYPWKKKKMMIISYVYIFSIFISCYWIENTYMYLYCCNLASPIIT